MEEFRLDEGQNQNPENQDFNFDDMIEDVTDTVGASDDATGDDGQKSDGTEIKNQTDFNNALKARLEQKERSVSNRYENSPEYILGKQLLRERMNEKSLSAEAAMAELQNERIQKKAAMYKSNPETFYEDYLRNQNGSPYEQTVNRQAESLATQIYEAKESGILPENFDPSSVTAEFIDNVQKYGVEAAAKIYSAGIAKTDNIVSELANRQRQPQPMRTSGNDRPNTKLDFENMSSEQFEAFDRKVQQAIAQGRKIRF